MASSIPTAARTTVQRRDQRCVRCGANGGNFHHRRRRKEDDEHTHCPCNGILLCGSGTTGCHGWAHSHPKAARELGLIVSAFVAEPSTIPVKTYRGWLLHDCTGRREPFPSATPGGIT